MRHRLALMVVDLCLIAVATVSAQLLRDNLETRLDQLLGLAPYLALTLVLAVPVLLGFGLNRGIWRLSAMADYLRVAGAAVMIITSAVVLGFLINRLDGVARSLPIIQGLLIVTGLAGVRIAARLRHARRNNGLTALPLPVHNRLNPPETILLVGANAVADLYLRSIAEFAAGRIRVAGVLAAKGSHTGRLLQEHSIIGTPELVGSILQDLEVHGVLVDRIVLTVAFDTLSSEGRSALLEVEKRSDIKLEFFAENIGLSLRAADAKATGPAHGPGDSPALALATDAGDLRTLMRPYWRTKRAIDVGVAICGLIVALPLILCVAILVALTSGFPLVFWQFRPGVGGRPFKLLKFRTMAAAHDSNGVRIDDTERQFRIGRVLRRLRLDELPQLYNVLNGDMSFIGPRPLLPVDQCPALPARLSIRPGITGWAQVKGGRELSATDKAALDVWYVKNASLGLDLTILLATVRMIVFGERTDQHAIGEAWRELGDAQQRQAPDQNANGTGGQEEAASVNHWRPSASITPLRKTA
jgi:lipopolysaccharide/colanic/teichoic acid biosynthesis glycosyltransferase